MPKIVISRALLNLFFFVFFSLFYIAKVVCADDLPPAARGRLINTPIVSGATQAEVSRALGEPDSREQPRAEVEIWNYGNSLVLFSGGRVSGWTDQGELAERKDLQEFSRPTNSVRAPEFSELGWHNAWTPDVPPNRSEEIDTLVDDIASRDNTNSK